VATTENNITKKIMLTMSRLGSRLFRVNTGRAYAGRAKRIAGSRDYVIFQARHITMGLTTGGSDLIGWTPIEITQEMVGKTVAVFSAVEVKTPKRKATQKQLQFIERVTQAGGFACVAYSEKESKEKFEEYLNRLGAEDVG